MSHMIFLSKICTKSCELISEYILDYPISTRAQIEKDTLKAAETLKYGCINGKAVSFKPLSCIRMRNLKE